MSAVSEYLNGLVKAAVQQEADSATSAYVANDHVGRLAVHSPTKRWTKSATIWVNCLAAALAALEITVQLVSGYSVLDPAWVVGILLILGPVNAVLRVLTVVPLTFGREVDDDPRYHDFKDNEDCTDWPHSAGPVRCGRVDRVLVGYIKGTEEGSPAVIPERRTAEGTSTLPSNPGTFSSRADS